MRKNTVPGAAPETSQVIKKNGTNGGVTGAFASIVNADNGESASSQILLCIKALHDAHLEPIDLAIIQGKPEDEQVFIKMVELLREHEFIAGPKGRVLLTTKGFKSLKTASANDYRVRRFLNNGQSVLAQHSPTEIVVSILRAHFDEWESE
ncbi:MAG: hypothetical protein GY927_04705 [bacterium]|nr:hypothetical protein [bacterium]